MTTKAEKVGQGAYREPDYNKRLCAVYQTGDVVEVGPRYVMGGTYEADDITGKAFTVLRNLAGTCDYKLTLGVVTGENLTYAQWDLIVPASRLQMHQK